MGHGANQEFGKGGGVFEAAYNDFYEEPLRQVVNAYEPLSGNTSWREFIQGSRGNDGLRPMFKCGGYGGADDCEEVVGDNEAHR